MRVISERGAAGYYSGKVAADLVGRLQELGGLHTLDDFAGQSAEYVEPIRTSYRGYELYECPPNGRGITALLMLNMLDGVDVARLDPLSAEWLHLQAETTKLAFHVTESLVADPARANVPVDWILSPGFAETLRLQIRPDRALEPSDIALPVHPDTVYLTVVDRDRTAVSFINSIYQAFGSGIVGPETGILLHNRGLGFVLDPEHPNCIGPRKRPLHTIIPAMLVKGGRAVMPFGVMGGLYQSVGQIQLLTGILDHGMDPQQAIDVPRSLCANGVYQLEPTIPDEVASELQRLGHVIERAEAPLGGAQAIWIDWDRGTLLGASDGRKDGCALGF
jgi:gamma-glutamyltranspeptidase/glutathione hydrolase